MRRPGGKYAICECQIQIEGPLQWSTASVLITRLPRFRSKITLNPSEEALLSVRVGSVKIGGTHAVQREGVHAPKQRHKLRLYHK